MPGDLAKFGLALVALVTYINLVNTVAKSMRQDGEPDLPTAKVV